MDYTTRLGLTPIYTRLAASFLARGVGEYACDTFGYDRVVVRETRAWNNYPPAGYQMELQVEFYTEGRRVKWVDFTISMNGGGGDASLTVAEVPDGD